MIKRYTLFLDESETHKHDPVTRSDSDYHFCMAGVIVAEDDYADLQNSVNQLKRNVWPEVGNPEMNILASRNRDSGAVETYIPDTETTFDWLNYHS